MNIVEKISNLKKEETKKTEKKHNKPNGEVVSSFKKQKKQLKPDILKKLNEYKKIFPTLKEHIIYKIMHKHEFKENLISPELQFISNNQKYSFSNNWIGSEEKEKKIYNKKTKKNKNIQNGDRKNQPKITKKDNKKQNYLNNVVNNNYENNGYYKNNYYKNNKKHEYNNYNNNKYIKKKNFHYIPKKQNFKNIEYVKKKDTKPMKIKNEDIEEFVKIIDSQKSKVNNNENVSDTFEYVKKETESKEKEELKELKKIKNKKNQEIKAPEKEYVQKNYFFSSSEGNGDEIEVKENESKNSEEEKRIYNFSLGLNKIVHTLKSKMRNSYYYIRNYTTSPQKNEILKKNFESKYKRKYIDVRKKFDLDIVEESSSYFGRNKIDYLIKKQFESEEERMKSKREKNLEIKLEQMYQIVKNMQNKIKGLEENLINIKNQNSKIKDTELPTNTYVLVPINLVKHLFTSEKNSNLENGTFQTFSLNQKE